MTERMVIETVENGFTVQVWKKEEDKDDEFGYREPETYVAKDKDEVIELIKKNC